VRRAWLLVAVLALTACGGSKAPTARDRVGEYIHRVDLVQANMQPALVAVHQSVVDFTQHRTAKTNARELAQADATLRKLQRRLARIDPPPQARKLHGLLQQLVAQEVTLASELQQLTVFDPAFVRALEPLVAANARTRTRLQGVTDPDTVDAAVRAYRASVARSLAALRGLHPPVVERPVFLAQVGRLEGLDRALGALERAVTARDAAAAAAAEHAVSVAAVSTDSRSAQDAQRAAVVAYDRSVRRVRTLTTAIDVERARLQRSL
jgi:hypothetical protein